MKPRIYHNPRCQKSRATLKLLQDRGLTLDIIEYLKTPPDTAQLRALVTKLGVAPRELVRTSEDEFKRTRVDLDSIGDEQIISLLAEHPKLLQRPIVETEAAARIGRPPEQVLDLFE